MVEFDIHFQKEENTTNACRPAYLRCTKMRRMTFRRPNPVTLHPYSHKQITELPVNLSSSLDVWFSKDNKEDHGF